MGVGVQFGVRIGLQHQNLVFGFCGRQLKGVDGPMLDAFHFGRRGKRFVPFAVVEHPDLHPFTVVDVNVMFVANFALRERVLMLQRLILLFDEHKHFAFDGPAEATLRDNDFNQFLNRGVRLRFYEFRLHPFLRVYI